MNGSGVMIDAVIDAVFRALGMAFAMGWEILWPLILGVTLSGHRPSSRVAQRNEPPSSCRSLTFDCHCTRPRSRFFILLLCSGGAYHPQTNVTIVSTNQVEKDGRGA